MTRLEEMAKAAWMRGEANPGETWDELLPDCRNWWIANERAVVERLIEIQAKRYGAATPLVMYLRLILTEHDRETTEPPRPSRP